ncbi:MAG TPA: DUF1045 domain-containing protein [Candidatus Binatia bacterium]|nr:DUF1045 domain-containing protein [Candidatus Binatia bacterium]
MTIPRREEERFALYWTPPQGSPLALRGAAWLGHDAAGEASGERPAVDGFDVARLAALTAAPAQYGLHATLKPPFRLAEGTDRAGLEAAIAAFAGTVGAFAVPPLRLAALDGFLALIPSGPSAALDALAARCVKEFDRFRRPAGPDELARRRAAGLSARQERHLLDWGYPYVLEDFRFHVTLTGALSQEDAARLMPALSAEFAEVIGAPLEIAELALFVQPGPKAPFVEHGRFALAQRR